MYWPEAGDKLELNTVIVEHIGEEKNDFDTVLFKVTLKEAFKANSTSNVEPLVVKQRRWSTLVLLSFLSLFNHMQTMTLMV